MADLVVALAVFSSAMLAVLGLFPESQAAQAHGRALMQATWVAERALEQERVRPYDQIVDRTSQVSLSDTATGTVRPLLCTVQTTVTEEAVGLKRVRVTVSWVMSRASVLQVETLVARLTS